MQMNSLQKDLDGIRGGLTMSKLYTIADTEEVFARVKMLENWLNKGHYVSVEVRISDDKIQYVFDVPHVESV